jgi:hypothetical protein
VGSRHRRALGDEVLGGHGTSIGGVIVDGGTFDFGKDPAKFPNYNTPEESYHGLVFARDLGVGSALGANLAFILKARVQLLRDLGPAISPFNAFLISQGVETLSLRMERHLENTAQGRAVPPRAPQVESVRWASLPDSPEYAKAQKYCPAGSGAVLAFEIAGGWRPASKFVEALQPALPRRQHRRRPLAGHPPRVDDPQPGRRRRPAGRRRHARPGPPRGGHRAHRRHPRRPRVKASPPRPAETQARSEQTAGGRHTGGVCRPPAHPRSTESVGR